MAELRNCSRCGKMFSYVYGSLLCYECKQQDEQDFKKVRDYLYENRGASLSQIAKELEISVRTIRKFLREGRLEIHDNSPNLFLDCEKCGKAIRSGRYCEDCERSIKSDLIKTADEMKKSLNNNSGWSKDGQMRYLNTRRK